MKNEDMNIALLVTRYLDPERDMIQCIACVVTPIVLMQRSWAILNLYSENPEPRHLDILHDEEMIGAVSKNLN